MSKDDYHVIVYKILAYLYTKLKEGDDVNVDYIKHNGKLFEINKKYWTYIFKHLQESGYIENVVFEKAWGKEMIICDLEKCQITPLGIEYVCENTLLKKVKEFLKDTKEITPFI